MAKFAPFPNYKPYCAVPCVDFAFTIDGGAGTPVISDDREGVIAASGVADTGTGVITVSLRHRYSYIRILSVTVADTDAQGYAAASVAVDPNTITITIVDNEATPAVVDTAGLVTVHARAYFNAQGT